MSENGTTNLPSEAVPGKLLRPALIASRRIIADYPAPLRHLLTGLADESVPAVFIRPLRCEVGGIVPPGIEVIQHPAYDVPLTGYYNRKILLERLARWRINVLHCLCESKASFTRWLSRRTALPYLVTVNSLPGRLSRLSLSSRRCAKIIVPAETIAERLTGNAFRHIPKALAGRIEQIKMGTFTSRAVTCFSSSDRVAGIIIAGSLEKVCDFETLFGALRHLAIDGHEFMIVLIGASRAQRPLWRLLSRLGMLRMVTFIDEWQSPEAVLAAGDIFIQPKPGRAFSAILLNAMSVGAAVAACPGGVDDLIIADKTAVTFDPADELSIYNCLRHLFNRKEVARKLATQARRYIRDNYTVSAMVADTIRAYADAIEWFKG